MLEYTLQFFLLLRPTSTWELRDRKKCIIAQRHRGSFCGVRTPSTIGDHPGSVVLLAPKDVDLYRVGKLQTRLIVTVSVTEFIVVLCM